MASQDLQPAEWWTQIRALLALAMARGASGYRAHIANRNNKSVISVAPIGASLAVTFSTTISPAVTGKFSISASFCASMDVANIPGAWQLSRQVGAGPIVPIGPVIITQGANAANFEANGSISEWIDVSGTVPTTSPLPVVTYAITGTAGAGHTFLIPTGGVSLSIQERN